MQMVLLEGAGDTVHKHYYPCLEGPVNDGAIKLWVTDVLPRPWALFPDGAADGNPVPETYFLYKGDTYHGDGKRHIRDKEILANMAFHIVFVVTPDAWHLKTAEDWLGRAHRIIVDKAFAPSTKEIDDFLTRIGNRRNSEDLKRTIWGFDHYRAATAAVRGNLKHFIRTIGGLEHIEFRLLETGIVKKHRTEVPGVIQDLAPHLFALLDLLGDLDSIRILRAVRKRHKDARRDGDVTKETFAVIEFEFASAYCDVPSRGRAVVGKGVGKRDEKILLLRGPQGRLILDFCRGTDRAIVHCVGDMRRAVDRLCDGHKVMIESLLSGTPEMDHGLLSLDSAREVVRLVEETYQHSIPPRGSAIQDVYRVGTPLNELSI